MLIILIAIALLWLIRTTKIVLFWLYLWQLKEYHIKRLIDHFKTAKGSELILDKFGIIKIVLLSLFLFNPLVVFIGIPFIYLLESGKAFLDLIRRKLLKPVFTAKTIAITSLVFFFEILFIVETFSRIDKEVWLSVFYFPVLLLIVDLVTPLIISWLVLAFEPLTWFSRKMILSKAERKIKKHKDLIVIGITGSYGKTSVKEFLAEILSSKYNVLKTAKHINAEIGIANTILKDLKDHHQVLIAEIGAYEKGKIKEVCKMIKPKIGILTGINDQHLATFGSQENIVKAKFELIDSLPKDGLAVLNWDSDLVRKEAMARNLNIKYKKCSVQGLADFFARDVRAYRDYLTFRLYQRTGDSTQIQANVLGEQNAPNIVLAVAVAKELGLDLNEISRACFDIKAYQGGILYLRKVPPIVIDATYSSNLDGVLADLEYLKLHEGKKVIIMPCLIELGKNSKKDHERIGRKIAEVCDLAIITSKECLSPIKENFSKTIYLNDIKEIVNKVKEFNIIFLEGRLPKKLIKELSNEN